MPSAAFQLKGLREKRAEIKGTLEKLGRTLHEESRGFRSDERETFDKLKADWVELGNQVRSLSGVPGEHYQASAEFDRPSHSPPSAEKPGDPIARFAGTL